MKDLDLEMVVSELNLEVITGHQHLNRKVKGAYCGDLLSDVMANSKEGYIWITVQTHQNIVAVSVLKEHAGIIISGNRRPDPESIEKAEKEGIPLLVSPQFSFQICGRLFELLNK